MVDALVGPCPDDADPTEWAEYARCVERGTHSERTETGQCVECGFARSDFPGLTTIQRMRQDDAITKGFPAAMAGDGTLRERYVTERAERLAREFDSAIAQGGSSVEQIDDYETQNVVRAFRDLIDRGVLK